jgi:hypothetical protein
VYYSQKCNFYLTWRQFFIAKCVVLILAKVGTCNLQKLNKEVSKRFFSLIDILKQEQEKIGKYDLKKYGWILKKKRNQEINQFNKPKHVAISSVVNKLCPIFINLKQVGNKSLAIQEIHSYYKISLTKLGKELEKEIRGGINETSKQN